ncbi:putative methyltransferase [Novipirellula galeiformis]|uniref:Methyltransferase n=1 Tax=Novipirellula galeiformis TaxID=2528004 RepID=A0A5C6CNA4_9BACT|nr:DNA methyltransferase [Novipirellula galeiformis]TWU24861.1 putative methyltransferase [Novipirellula galeiformis]
MTTLTGRYSTAEKRWSGVGPYYAMFPSSFAEQIILKYTSVGDRVLDPFAGRGTSIYSAAINQRIGIGIEINPVGWVYSKAKLNPAGKSSVQNRLEEIGRNAFRYRRATAEMPPFFRHCYTEDVLSFLLTCRSWLNWRQSKTDWTLMSLLLVHLHGKRTDSFSNQMRQAKSMSPPYAIRWWKENNQQPPQIDPVKFMQKKLDWRYKRGCPVTSNSEVYLGNSIVRLGHIAKKLSAASENVKLLFTSPPYCGVTDYHYDQWLRLWMLGGEPSPSAPQDSLRGKFIDREKYKKLLLDVFRNASRTLADDAIVYVRTDRRKLTLEITKEVLQEVFPHLRMRSYTRLSPEKTQTDLFANLPAERGETDVVLYPR